MSSDERYAILERAIDAYGYPHQMIMAMEEMSELTKEICKGLRGMGDIDHIAEEIADVRITVDQLCMMYDIWNEVADYETIKLHRLEENMNDVFGS